MSLMTMSRFQDHDTFSLLDADTWSGLTWLSLAGLGSLVSGLMLAWSCVGKQITRDAIQEASSLEVEALAYAV